MQYNEFKEELEIMVKNNSDVAMIDDFILKTIKSFPLKKVSISKAVFSVLKDKNPRIAYNYIKEVVDEIRDEKFLNILKKRLVTYFENGLFDKNEFQKMNKKVILNIIIETFLKELKEDSEMAFYNLDSNLNKYYYLKVTVIKRLLKRLKKDSVFYTKLATEYL
jgi:hypothetical protein